MFLALFGEVRVFFNEENVVGSFLFAGGLVAAGPLSGTYLWSVRLLILAFALTKHIHYDTVQP